MPISQKNGIDLTLISALNGISKSSIGALNDLIVTQPTIFASDDFTGTNGAMIGGRTPVVGGTWTVHPSSPGGSNMQINANTALVYISSQPIIYVNTAAATANYSVKCKVYSSSWSGGPVGRLSSSGINCYLVAYNGGANAWQLYAYVAGTPTMLGQFVGDNPTTPRTIELIMSGSTISVKIENTTRISVTDTSVTAAGYAGISAAGTSDEYMDDFVATSFTPFGVIQTSARNRATLAAANTAFPSNVTAGSRLVVLAMCKNRAGTVVPTDTLGNTYILDGIYTETGFGSWSVHAYSTVSGSAGANTVQLSASGADEITIIAQELPSGTVKDKTGSGAGSNWGTGSDTVPTTGTLTYSNSVVYTLAMGRCTQTTSVGFATLPAPSGYTGLGTAYLGDGTATNSPCHAAYQVVSTTTALTPTWTATEAQTNLTPSGLALMTITYGK